ncbi:MAG TPA: hypothetical protein VNK26_07240, partial [Pyrinomonadaceae bacterium]|nr:hypothetical protein [Pyrinomonadaceae bacterium]
MRAFIQDNLLRCLAVFKVEQVTLNRHYYPCKIFLQEFKEPFLENKLIPNRMSSMIRTAVTLKATLQTYLTFQKSPKSKRKSRETFD